MQLKDISSIAIIFVMAGIVLGIGAQITRSVGLKGAMTTVVNESTTIVGGSCSNLANPISSITQIINGTGATITGPNPIVGSTNYTLCDSGDSGVNFIVNASLYPASSYNFTYEAKSSKTWRTTSNATRGMEELAGWMPLIGLVIAAALIITIIFSSFGVGRGEV